MKLWIKHAAYMLSMEHLLLYLEMKEWEMYHPEKIPKPKKETSLNEENDTRTYQSSLGLSASPRIFLKRENHATSSLH